MKNRINKRPLTNQLLVHWDNNYFKPAIAKASWNEDPNLVLKPSDFTPIVQLPTEHHIVEKQSLMVKNGKQSKMRALVRTTPTGVHLVNEFALPNTKWKCHIPKQY